MAEVTPERLAEYALAGYEVCKAKNPNCTVTSPSVGRMAPPYLAYLSQFLTALTRNPRATASNPGFDDLAIHGYRKAGSEGPDEIDDPNDPYSTFYGELMQVRNLVHSFPRFVKANLWMTEIAYNSDAEALAPTPEDRCTDERGLRESVQAEALSWTYELILSDPDLDFVKAVFWFELRDINVRVPTNTGELVCLPRLKIENLESLGSALIYADGTLKEAFGRYRALANPYAPAIETV